MDQKTIAINMMVTGPFPAQMAANGAAVQTFGNQANAGMAKAQTGMAKFGKVAQKVGTFALLGVAAGLALSAKAAIDFESSFAGIRKTVDTSEAGFAMLAKGIRQMATEIPIGVNELNRIGELGGQLGVDPANLLEFTEVIAKIGVTTTLTTETAAMGFARIDNVMQLSGKSFDNMGATIVDLGNNFAATEDEILTFATRIAPIGATVGMATDEVLGIATAFTSVGVPAERGGTAVQKTFIKMAEAAKNGGVELDIFAETAGMTATAFAEMFEDDPAQAFTAFVEGLGRVKDEGGNVFAVLEGVELSNQRVISSLLAMANAEGVLQDALDLSVTAWGDNTALTEEAQKRFETTASALIILKNKVQDIAISLGSSLLPEINTFIDGGGALVDFFANLDATMTAVILGVPAFLAALTVIAAHPAVAALIGVGVGIYAIGAMENNNAAGVASAEKSVKDLEGVFSRGALQDYLISIGTHIPGIIDDLNQAGLSMDDFVKAVNGSDEEWKAFTENYRLDSFIAWHGFDFWQSPTSEVMERTRKEWIDAQVSVKEAHATSLNTMDENEIAFLQRTQDRIDANRGSSGPSALVSEEPLIPGSLATIIDDEYLGDIDTMFDDYVNVFTEAFDETDERIRSQIDLWYEFGDALEINFGELIPNLLRQVQAVGEFETVLEGLGLSPKVEEFIRKSFNTGALKEGFLDFRNATYDEFMIWINQIEAIFGPNGPLMSVIFGAFEADVPDLEFAAGAELLASMSGIVDEILANHPEYDAGQVWAGVIQASLIAAGPALAPQFIETLTAIFGEGGIPGIDLTIEEILEMVGALDLLPTIVEVEVRTNFTQNGEPYDPMYGAPISITEVRIPEGTGSGHLRAMGGPVSAQEPYWVGELGPEVFVPFSNGTIIPNSKLSGLGGTSNSTTVNVIRPESNDLAGDISEGLTRASISEQVDLIGAY